MSGFTTNTEDKDLGHGVDIKPGEQQKKYLVLPKEERAKGFVRPYRSSYIHVGIGGHEVDPNDISKHGRTGKGCGALTHINIEIAESFARDPKFYGATYCIACKMHLLCSEFVWEDGEVVGS